jgi:NADPH-dependent 2,4-dienoyl-CoA reductase/sulfur reductase-like enzyme
MASCISLIAITVLLLATRHVLATTPACSSKALSAEQAAHLTFCKVLIVGAGPGGLYSAYFLRELGPDLCVVEKKKELGGGLSNILLSTSGQRSCTPVQL